MVWFGVLSARSSPSSFEIKNELPSEPEIRAELGLAMQRFQAELKSAQKKREAPQRGHLPFNGQQPISAPSTHL